MQKKKQARLIVLCAIAMVGSAFAQTPPAQAGAAQSLEGTFVAKLELATAADGSVSEVKAVGQFPDAVKQLIEKRVATWRFAPMVWQGKPASTRFYRFLRLQLVPTTSGGFAVRSRGFAANSYAREYSPPQASWRWYAFRKHVVFAYRVAVTPQGQVTDVVALLPEKHDSQQSKQFSRNIAQWLPNWRVKPFEADGAPVACQRIYIAEHGPDNVGTRISQELTGWADEADLQKLPAEDAQRLTQELAKLQDGCQSPVLQTAIDDVVL